MTHHCHWPGCKIHVRDNLSYCWAHWEMLPKHIRSLIQSNYVIGQEITKTPTYSYMEAAKLAHDFAIQYELRKKEKMDLLSGIEELMEEIK